jgi:hypothetical protein
MGAGFDGVQILANYLYLISLLLRLIGKPCMLQGHMAIPTTPPILRN